MKWGIDLKEKNM